MVIVAGHFLAAALILNESLCFSMTAEVAFTLNRFGPICRLEGEEHTIEPSVEEVKVLDDQMPSPPPFFIICCPFQ